MKYTFFFHFTRGNKSHIHSKHLNILYLSGYGNNLDAVNSFEQQRKKTYLLTCASNEDSNQPVYPRSLIRVFFFCIKDLCNLGCPKCAL